MPEEESEWTDEQRARWLLAQLLEWHRREDKSMWWEYYRLCELSDEESIEDKNALPVALKSHYKCTHNSTSQFALAL